MKLSRKTYYWQILGGVLIVMALVFQGLPVTTALAAATTITINSSGAGRVFDGVGAISGGGGTSRLLWDYPTQQQSEILDYLFKPNYGASLQIFKVEIGGDTNSSEGAEPSHMRTSGSENYQRGYEWWLMEQAKARNPNIKFAALEWGAPGWFSGGFWSTDNINYIVKWIQHAQSDHGVTISYIGGWNERGYNITWYENLRTALNTAGLSSVKIIADDGLGSSNWAVANDLSTNSAFKAAVSVAGTHYTNTSTSTAQGLGMPLWSSENGSVDYDSGGPTVANKLNLDYINGKMTAYLHWNAVAAYYRTLPFYPWGTILADEPWSGYYKVGRNVWALAQTAQFVQPGWQYIDNASGTLAGSGTYVTLKSTNNSDYSIIFETNGASASQTVNVSVTGLSSGVVHVWSTNMGSTSPSTYMVKGSDVTPSGGSYSLTLQPGYVYSVTTTTGQGKGSTTPPASAIMSIPYSDNFEGYGATGKLAKYFTDLNGAFETANCTGGHTGMCYRQVINAAPISWTTSPGPTTVFGDPRWTNYQVSTDALLEQTGSIDLVGRMNLNTHAQTGMQGYHLQVNSSGAWSLFKQVAAGTNTSLASGTVSFPLNSWHNLALDMQGSTIKAYYDNGLIATVTDSTYATGQATLEMGGWQLGQFDNFAVTAAHSTGPTATPTAGPSPTPTNTPTVTNTPVAGSNLALGKTATADSVQTANPAANGNDGSTTTRWCAANGNLNHWWSVDLGASHPLTGSEVMWEKSGLVYKYKVEVSTDNTNWTLVVDKTNNTSTAQTQNDPFTANARYVRITVTGLSTNPVAWASFWEFRVFGS